MFSIVNIQCPTSPMSISCWFWILEQHQIIEIRLVQLVLLITAHFSLISQWSQGGDSMRAGWVRRLKFPSIQPHECVDSPGLARSPAGKSGLKLLHSSWRSAGRVPLYGHPPLLLAPRVRPKSPHANVKIGPGPRKRPPEWVSSWKSVSALIMFKEVDVCSWIASPLELALTTRRRG